MSSFKNAYVNQVFEDFCKKNQGQLEYIDACKEILESLELCVENDPRIEKLNILERFLEPERFITFRVPWVNDKGEVKVNRGFRVQYNSALGPYKGGTRFHPSVNESIIKFLGLEQCLKNSLTGLPLGGGKGGADFDSRGKSDNEIMRFCQAYISELYRHIGKDVDVPAGDLGVGAKEVGYMFGYYKKIQNEFGGVFTGKGLSYGGSLVRTQATGYGVCYFAENVLKTILKTDFKNKKTIISGFGNVAFYAIEKALELGANVIGVSNIDGCIYDENGVDFALLKDIRENKNSDLKEYVKIHKHATFKDNPSLLWEIPCEIALPCATQNEIDLETAKTLVKNGLIMLCEGANMPCRLEAIHYFIDNNIVFGPGKAANAGGVATSGLEMSQNSMRYSWSFEEVDEKLKGIMKNIFVNIYETNKKYGIRENDLITCANIVGFNKLCDAMIMQGVI